MTQAALADRGLSQNPRNTCSAPRGEPQNNPVLYTQREQVGHCGERLLISKRSQAVVKEER